MEMMPYSIKMKQKNIERYLLNQFEILSTQVEYAKIDVNIVDSITGNIITSVMGNNTVQNVISEIPRY